MGVLFVIAFLFAVTSARVPDFVNCELSAPFNDFYKYLQCIPIQIDQYSMEYDCEPIWDEYRGEYLNTITAFEDCSTFNDENDIEKYLINFFFHHLNFINFNNIFI